MKNNCFFILLAVFLLGSCTTASVEPVPSPETEVSLPDLKAGFGENLTRTYVESNKYQKWHEADQITVFYGRTLNSQYQFQGATGDEGGTFSEVATSGEDGAALPAIYAVYPYREDATITEEGVISLKMPAVQKYAENSFGKGANTMFAVTESKDDFSLAFRNACGYLKLRLYGDDVTVKTLVVKGNNQEKVAGAATATMTYGGIPEIVMGTGESSTRSVTIDCGDGVTLGATEDTATEFWVVLPVMDFESGITLLVNYNSSDEFEKSTSNKVSITRNEIQPMGVLKVEEYTKFPESNEMWYTSTNDDVVVTPKGSFDPAPESNTYADERGVIQFNAVLTSIGEKAFYGCSTLSSIIIPSEVTSIGADAFGDCTSLETVYCMADEPPAAGDRMFETYVTTLKIYVPSESVEHYKEDWSDYESYIFGYDFP